MAASSCASSATLVNQAHLEAAYDGPIAGGKEISIESTVPELDDRPSTVHELPSFREHETDGAEGEELLAPL